MSSGFATTVTAEPQGLGRSSMLPSWSIRFPHVSVVSGTRGCARDGVPSRCVPGASRHYYSARLALPQVLGVTLKTRFGTLRKGFYCGGP